MSDNSHITITLGLPSFSDSGPRQPTDGLILEQCLKSDRYIRKIDLVRALMNQAYGTNYPEPSKASCMMRDAAVCVYLYNPSLNYNIGITHGEIGERTVVPIEVRESVKFSLTKEESIKYPTTGIISAEWQGTVYDKDGSVITGPTIHVSGSKITVPFKVYGVVLVTYAAEKHHYDLSISAREGAEFSNFDSIVWANWDGGAKLLVIEYPMCSDAEDEEDGIETYLEVTFPDDDIRGPSATGHNYEKVIDYCSQRVVTSNVPDE